MLAMADKHGRIWASIPGLASRAKVTIPEVEKALKCFLSPDKYSRTQDHEGRRIVAIDGGWKLLNHAKYRAIRDEEERRAYKTEWQRKARSVDNVDKSGLPCTDVYARGHNAEAEAYTEAEKEVTPDSLNTEAWLLYSEHRRELKAKRLTPRGVKMAMNKLAALSSDDQMRCVETTVANGWTGLFPEKVNGTYKQTDSFDAKLANLREKAGLNQTA